MRLVSAATGRLISSIVLRLARSGRLSDILWTNPTGSVMIVGEGPQDGPTSLFMLRSHKLTPIPGASDFASSAMAW